MKLPTLTFSQKSNRTPESPISYFMEQAIENPTLISLAAGMVDGNSLPSTLVAEAMQSVLGDPIVAKAALQYGTTQGYIRLREKILQLIARLDHLDLERTNFGVKDILVTTGSQQLLYMLSELLFDPGDIVITEAPSYFVYHSVLTGAGVRVLSVPMDNEGMNVDALIQLLERLERSGEISRVKLVYVIDYFQNPSGRTLSLPRRNQLLEAVRRFSTRQRILILEDAAYRELRYEGDDIPSIKSLDQRNETVIYAGTFSKPCAPGLKTGYALMPRELIAPMLRLKGNHDFGSNNLSQYVLNRLMETGAYQRHAEYLCGVYRQKRDAMLQALEREFGTWPGVEWTHPCGGMFVWLKMPEGIDMGPKGRLLDLAIRKGVLYIPGEFGHVTEAGLPPTHEARLSFGDAAPEQIREGIRRLREATEELFERPRPNRALPRDVSELSLAGVGDLAQ